MQTFSVISLLVASIECKVSGSPQTVCNDMASDGRWSDFNPYMAPKKVGVFGCPEQHYKRDQMVHCIIDVLVHVLCINAPPTSMLPLEYAFLEYPHGGRTLLQHAFRSATLCGMCQKYHVQLNLKT